MVQKYPAGINNKIIDMTWGFKHLLAFSTPKLLVINNEDTPELLVL
jgi:hypothetical protein